MDLLLVFLLPSTEYWWSPNLPLEGAERREMTGSVFVFLSLKNGVGFPRRILSSILATTMKAFHCFYPVFTNTVNHTSLHLLNLPVGLKRFQR